VAVELFIWTIFLNQCLSIKKHTHRKGVEGGKYSTVFIEEIIFVFGICGEAAFMGEL
jgi:hypothetical protein